MDTTTIDYLNTTGISKPKPLEYTIKCFGKEYKVNLTRMPKLCYKCSGRGHRGLQTVNFVDNEGKQQRMEYPVICSCIKKVWFYTEEEIEKMKEAGIKI